MAVDSIFVKSFSESFVKRAFGQALREARLDAGLSQMKLAEKAGLHFTFVSATERGVRNVSLVNIVRLSRALNVPTAQLLADVDSPKY